MLEFCYITFSNISKVLQAEKSLKSREIPHHPVPIPRNISSDCGMCIMSLPKYKEEIKAALVEAGVDFEEVIFLKHKSNSFLEKLFK